MSKILKFIYKLLAYSFSILLLFLFSGDEELYYDDIVLLAKMSAFALIPSGFIVSIFISCFIASRSNFRQSCFIMLLNLIIFMLILIAFGDRGDLTSILIIFISGTLAIVIVEYSANFFSKRGKQLE